jgi:GTP-binding protein EngB required for normal cell division
MRAAMTAESPLSPQSNPRPQDGLAAILERAEILAAGLWPQRKSLPDRIREFRARLQEGHFHLAIVGQFKRGKSSVLNALLGAPLLPTGVVPLTSVPTFIRWADRPGVRVHYDHGRPPEQIEVDDIDRIRSTLFRFVAEQANPSNRLGVRKVELQFPADILANGVVLIDTPGIGSTLRHNTDAALRILPDCDAGLFVISVDPPITELESEYLNAVCKHVARLFVVLNKIDTIRSNELGTALEFLASVLREQLSQREPTIFPLSARDGLEGKMAKHGNAVEASGLANLEHHLFDFLAREKVEALRSALATKLHGTIAGAIADLMLEIRALETPLADLESKASQFSQTLKDIARELLTVRDLLAGDRRRSIEALEEHAERLRREAREHLLGIADAALASHAGGPGSEEQVQTALKDAIPEFFESKLRELSTATDEAIRTALASHNERTERLIDSVHAAASELFDLPAIPAAQIEPFAIRREPYWVTQDWNQTFAALPEGLLDRVLPTAIRRRRFRDQFARQVSELVQRNVENLRWALLQTIEDAVRQFAAAIDDQLDDAIATTQGAIRDALTMRQQQTESVGSELHRLRRGIADLEAMQAELAPYVAKAARSAAE